MPKARPIDPKHQEFLDEHFQAGVPSDWRSFHRKLRSKSFAQSVRQDPRSDAKLKRFAKMVSFRQSSKQPGVAIVGDTGRTYKVRYHPEAKRFSCSCKDWTYARSHKHRGTSGNCKHIQRVQDGVKQQLMEKTARSIRGRAALALIEG